MIDMSELPPKRQLDFWLGEWDVRWGEQERGTNRIRRALEAQVIQEEFDARPSIDFQGRSVSVYREAYDEWHQTWVDTRGNYWHLRGGWEGDRFVLVTDDIVEGEPVKYRMVFHDIKSDMLVWDWQISQDQGESWELRWRIHYSRRADAAADGQGRAKLRDPQAERSQR